MQQCTCVFSYNQNCPMCFIWKAGFPYQKTLALIEIIVNYDVFWEFWTPWFLGHHQLSALKGRYHGGKLLEKLRKPLRDFFQPSTTFVQCYMHFEQQIEENTYFDFEKCHNRQNSSGVSGYLVPVLWMVYLICALSNLQSGDDLDSPPTWCNSLSCFNYFLCFG